MRNINSVFLTVVKKAITNIQIRHEESEDVIIHIKQDFKEDARDDDSSSVYGIISHYVNTKEIIREIADEIFKLQEAEFIKKDLIMMLLDYREREIFSQLQVWWDFLSSRVTGKSEDTDKIIVTICDEPLYNMSKDITHFIFNGEEMPLWFILDFSFMSYEKLVSIEGTCLKELDLGLFQHSPNLEEIITPNANIINYITKDFPKLTTVVSNNISKQLTNQ